MSEIFVNCPKGLEGLLGAELSELGAGEVRETVAGVYAVADHALIYRICLWSRLANRVLLPLARFEVNSADDLYRGARDVSWLEHMDADTTFAVDFAGRNDAIRHTGFGARRVKDAVADQILEARGRRPDVDPRRPQLRINAYLSRGRLALGLDLSGESLHRRGYRRAMVAAPLKENLAAALLLRAGWPDIAARGGGLIDPLCGSGTLLIEGAMMAADIAPGLEREAFGFQHWRHFDAQLWRELRDEALARRERGLARELPEMRGYDKDRRAVEATRENVTAAGLDKVVRVSPKPLEALKRPTHRALGTGLLLTNPPYGERWGEVDELRSLYATLGRLAKAEFPGWRLGVFTGNPELGQELRLRADKQYALFNGTIPAKLLLFQLREAGTDETASAPRALTEPERMLANRLGKNARRLKGWLQQSGVACYRLYDADIPEYAFAIDCYEEAIHVQEYAPPATVDPAVARRRRGELRRVLLELYPGSRDQLYFKERRRQTGDSQYRPGEAAGEAIRVVPEGPARVEVNLADYLDTGLFLDHRPVRDMIRGMAEGKRFLNLFCYTAVATVHAGLGGAAESLSVDMSNTYLEWAARNFTLNGLDAERHRTLRADCLEWLAQPPAGAAWDLIFLDPPTFSNSARMQDVLDIQRDHAGLVRRCMERLDREGTLIFSNNFRRFRLDAPLAEEFAVEDITEATIPPDFRRNRRIHHCFRIRHRG